MYHPTVVEQRLTTMLDAVRRTVPGAEAPARTLAEVAEWDARLSTAWDPDTKTAKRPLDDEEQRFILGEKLRSKADWRYCAERYFKIRDEGGSLITIPLRRTQEIILRKLGEMEASTAARNDGVLALVLKARQLGVSTLTELLIAHKALFYSHRHCLIASDIPENSAYLFDGGGSYIAMNAALKCMYLLIKNLSGQLRQTQDSCVLGSKSNGSKTSRNS